MSQEFKRSVVLYSDDCIKLHGWNTDCGDPILVIPPHAGRHGCITQRLIDGIASCSRAVYTMELLPATSKTCKLDVLGLVGKMKICVDTIGNSPLDIVGVCQGGWLSAIFISLYPETAKSFSMFASPINTKTGEDNSIEDYCSKGSLDYHKGVVALNGGIQLGSLQWLAFAISNPMPTFFTRYYNLYVHFLRCDSNSIDKWIAENNWYDSPIDLHGGWFIEALDNHFFNNRLYDGTWVLSDGRVPKLENITCPLHIYTGEDDQITHPTQALDIINKVSSKVITTKNFEKAGHTAVFTRGSCIDYFLKKVITI